ncbi:MAG: helix-turn-helix domain-containing protein [Planctomycetota bacterium]|jgi:AraC-like DNA-binding protein/mannose-6-phosphate isomerase-like protein (cupin superfamily)
MDRNKISCISPDKVTPAVLHVNYVNVLHSGWPGHNVPDPELVIVIEGNLTAEDEDHPKTTLSAGDAVFLRPGKPCDLLRTGNIPLVISCMHFELSAGLQYDSGAYKILPEEPWVIHTQGHWEIIELFRRLNSEFKSYHPYRRELLSTLAKELWIRLMAINQNHKAEKQRSLRLEAMVAFIRSNIKKGVTRYDLANEFDLTPEYINNLFRKELNLTPTAVLNRERVLTAARMLSEGRLSVTEAAKEVGFSDQFYFSRVFKKEFGFPPSRMLTSAM